MKNNWTLPLALIVLTFLSTLYVGAGMEGSPGNILTGWPFALPLMAILLAHEFGHYIAGRIHRVPISPPYFIPVPFFLLGTMGAVIHMRGRIKTRNALLDIGASGPLAGLLVTMPVLVYGIATSEIRGMPETGSYLIEGRSLFYLLCLYICHGPLPAGQDIWLNSTAFAGWAGLLVTMINLLPVGQLDGGHVAYALWGKRQNSRSEFIRHLLPFLGLVISLCFWTAAYLQGIRGEALIQEFMAGMHWVFWAGILWLMTRLSGKTHPPTDDDQLSPKRKAIGWLTLCFFVLLFMPSWIRVA
ncbi:MAG: site-2 protease family protein [Myxococcales bacterium]|nr:MAG: site-2 protease family protein [Myxococcales bacterium]